MVPEREAAAPLPFYQEEQGGQYCPEVESRTQGSRPRPRTQKNPRRRPRTALPRTDPHEAKDRNARGQGQGPRTQAQVLSKKKSSSKNFFQAISKRKRSSQKFFRRSLRKTRLPKNFLGAPQNFNYSKNSAVLEPRTRQFSRTWGFEAKAKDLTFEAKDFKMCPRGRPRGQGHPQGLHLSYSPFHFSTIVTKQTPANLKARFSNTQNIWLFMNNRSNR